MANRTSDLISLFRSHVSNTIDGWSALHIDAIEMADRGLIGQVDADGNPVFGFTEQMFTGANSDISPADMEQAIAALQYINSLPASNRAALQKVRI